LGQLLHSYPQIDIKIVIFNFFKNNYFNQRLLFP
jgi:hypothetical protein